jgi:NADPH2:quinone reductase
MKAIAIGRNGGPEVFQVVERPIPVYGDDQVLIEVKLSGLNRPDVWQRKGKYPAPKGVVQDILGLEVSGVISACGKNVTKWKIGDRVGALLAGGGYAAYAVAHQGHCLPLNEEISFEHAACIPETLCTIWHNLVDLGGLGKDKKVLIHGGSGGIGTMGIQVSKWLQADVFVTASSPYKVKICEQLGAQVIPYLEQDFAEKLKDIPMDVILDSIGGPYFEKNLKILANDGYLIYINSIKGAHVPLDLSQLMIRRHHITGSTLRPRSIEFKTKLIQRIEHSIWPSFLNGSIKPFVHSIFEFNQIQEAHQLLDSGEFAGKIAIRW